MWLRRIITLFCFIVLSFQLLPVRQLGSLLFSNQLTEECPHDSDGAIKDSKDMPDFKKDFIVSYGFIACSFMTASNNSYIHFSTELPSFLASDVHTPPPNGL